MKKLIYTIVDLLFLGRGVPRRINGMVFRFPARWSRYFEKDYEQENLSFLRTVIRSGDTILDVGAHLGLMSLSCSKLAGQGGKVYSFEPSPTTFSQLKKMLSLNRGGAPVDARQMAVGLQNGPISFYESDDEGSNSNSLVQKHDLKRKPVTVPCISIDQFTEENCPEQLHVIKIDAEGVELDVLKGAEQTLRKHRPFLVLAIHPRLIQNYGQRTEDIYTFIKNLNYRVQLGKRDLNKEEFCSQKDFFDVHLIPIEA